MRMTFATMNALSSLIARSCSSRCVRRLQFKPGMGACRQASSAHLLQATVDRSSSRCHDDARARRWRPSTRRADAWSSSAPVRAQRRCAPTVSAGMLAASAPRPGGQSIRTPPVPPPARGAGGRRVMRPCGQHMYAYGHAIWAADQMHTPSKERLPFGSALPAACAPGAVGRRRARTRRQTGRGRLSRMNPSPVATLPRRSPESSPSHRRADGGDD